MPNLMTAYDLFHKGTLALADMERNGFLIDKKYYLKKSKELANEQFERLEKIKKDPLFRPWLKKYRSLFNLNSPDQLRWFLYEELGLKPLKESSKGSASTDAEALEKLNMPELNSLIRIRKIDKIRNTYIKNFIIESVDNVIHPNYNLHIPATYRSSSSAPNFQNIPIRNPEIGPVIRGGIIPRPGCQIVEVDYGAIEVAISAVYHKDPNMIKYIEDESTDMHRDTCKDIFMLNDAQWTKDIRGIAKNKFVFPQFYGDYYASCALALWEFTEHLKTKEDIPVHQHLRKKGIRNYKMFEDHVKKAEDIFWNERFPVYNDWRKRQFRLYKQKGYLTTKLGFKFSTIMDWKQCSNYPIQGTAFHCLLWSVIQVNEFIKRKGLKSFLMGQIHDSMILNVYPEEREYLLKYIRWVSTIKIREVFKWINVPLKVEAEITGVDEPWSMKKDYKF